MPQKPVVKVLVAEKNGQISITKSTTNQTDDIVSIRLVSISEKDAKGNVVGSLSDGRHTYTSFASKDFNVSQVNPNCMVGDVNCSSILFEAKNISAITDRVYGNVTVFKSTGFVDLGGKLNETVRSGFVQFTFGIDYWAFCTNMTNCVGVKCCKNGNIIEVGEFLDLELEIKGNSTAASYYYGSIYNLGNAKLILTNWVIVDGKEVSMPIGYPKIANNTFILRIPKFANSAIFDNSLIEMNIPIIPAAAVALIIVIVILILILIIAGGCCLRRRRQKVMSSLIDSRN
jgi:hypothetical protein